MKHKLSLFLSFATMLLCGIASFAAPNSDCSTHPAMVEVRQTIDGILAELDSQKSSLKSNPKIVYGIIDRMMVPKADFSVMSQLVLTRNWTKMSAAEQDAFSKEFSKQIVRTYGVAFESYDGETVEYNCPVKKLPGSSSRVEVNTTIHSMKRPDSNVKFRILGRNNACKSCSASIESCKTTGAKCKTLAGDELTACKTDYDTCRKEVETCKASCEKCQQCEKGGDQSDCGGCQTQWLVYDLIIDNISIIESYRNIYADKFRRLKTADKVIAEMRAKNN